MSVQELQKEIAQKENELGYLEQDCKKLCEDEPKDKAKGLKLQLKTIQDDVQQLKLDALQQHEHLQVKTTFFRPFVFLELLYL